MVFNVGFSVKTNEGFAVTIRYSLAPSCKCGKILCECVGGYGAALQDVCVLLLLRATISRAELTVPSFKTPATVQEQHANSLQWYQLPIACLVLI